MKQIKCDNCGASDVLLDYGIRKVDHNNNHVHLRAICFKCSHEFILVYEYMYIVKEKKKVPNGKTLDT